MDLDYFPLAAPGSDFGCGKYGGNVGSWELGKQQGPQGSRVPSQGCRALSQGPKNPESRPQNPGDGDGDEDGEDEEYEDGDKA